MLFRDFSSHFKAESLYNLPYPPLLVPLAVFFAAENNKEISYDDNQRKQISRWFWRSALSRRYSAGFSRNLHTDITEILKLRNGEPSALGDFNMEVNPNFFTLNDFGMGNVNTKTFILLLASNNPLSFISGSTIDLTKKLKAANRNEFHHLMPKAYLRQANQISYSENCLANFCFISRADNRDLGGEAPSQYKQKLPQNHQLILEASLCPLSLWDDDYNTFINDRTKILMSQANSLCQL